MNLTGDNKGNLDYSVRDRNNGNVKARVCATCTCIYTDRRWFEEGKREME